MSDSSSANSNSWTLLATEENVAETLRPVAEGIENHADILDPATVEPTGETGDGKGAVPAERGRSEESWQAPQEVTRSQEVTGSQEVDLERVEDAISHVQHNTSDATDVPNLTPDPAHDPNLTPDPVGDVPSSSSVEGTDPDPAHDSHMTPDPAHDSHMTPDPAHDSHMTPDPTSVTNDHFPSSLEIPAPSNPDLDTASQLAGSSESQAPPSPDPDSFSESYTHISPSAEEGSGFLLTETLGAEEEAELIQEGEAVHHLNGEGLGQEEEESELSQRVTEDGKRAVKLVDQLVRDLFHIWARKLAGQAVSVPSGVGEEWAGDGREESSEVRRRRRGSLLAALERIGRRDEEEEEEEEDLRLPQREEETGFSLNKCILGAIILLGLGTIFFSGVFMDLEEEGEYDVREMRDTEVTGKHEWLNPEVPPPPVDVDNPELLNKPSEENLHVSVLQAQLQAQKEELKVAQGQAAEGAKERVRREEVEKENGRLKKEASSLPVLLKENEKMKRDLASVPALQREVETLRATVTELKHIPASDTTSPPVSPAAAPPPGPVEDGSLNTDSPAEEEVRTLREGEGKEKKKKKKDWMTGNEWKKNEPGQGKEGKEEWKEQGEKDLRDGGKKDWKPEKEWKKGKRDKESDSQGGKKREEKKEWKGKEKTGEWKKERESRGDEGKPWKNREERKEGRGKSERKDWKKGENAGDGKEWKGRSEKKEKRGGKRYVDENEGTHEGEGGEERRHEKDGGRRHEKDGGRRHKDKGEKKQWKGDKDWKKKDGGREWKREEEERPRQGKEKEWPREGDREEERPRQGKEKEWPREGDREEERPRQGKEKEWPREGDRKKERRGETWRQEGGSHHRGKDEHKHDKHEKSHHGFTEREGGKKDLWHGPGEGSPPPSHRSPPLEQPNYWLLQRERLQHNPSPQAKCTSVETCAQAEGLLPVPLPEFEALLLGYLAKAERVGVEASRREELRKLATEFFKDGVFAHDQMSFRDFVEDLGDILEDMVDGEEDEDEEEGGIEEEMDGFDDEAMRKFAVPGGGEEKRGERKKEAGRGHG